VYYFHTQPNGLPEELSDNSGHLVWTAQYSTWGGTVREEWHSYDEAERPVRRMQQQSAGQVVEHVCVQRRYLSSPTLRGSVAGSSDAFWVARSHCHFRSQHSTACVGSR
jgi:hypothetical protein